MFQAQIGFHVNPLQLGCSEPGSLYPKICSKSIILLELSHKYLTIVRVYGINKLSLVSSNKYFVFVGRCDII